MEGGPTARARMVLNCIKNLKHKVKHLLRVETMTSLFLCNQTH